MFFQQTMESHWKSLTSTDRRWFGLYLRIWQLGCEGWLGDGVLGSEAPDCCSEQGALNGLKECRDLDSRLAEIVLLCVWHFCSGLKPENALGFCKELTEPILKLSLPPQFYEHGVIKRSHKTHSYGLYYHKSIEGREGLGRVLLSANLDTQVHLLLTDPDPVLLIICLSEFSQLFPPI